MTDVTSQLRWRERQRKIQAHERYQELLVRADDDPPEDIADELDAVCRELGINAAEEYDADHKARIRVRQLQEEAAEEDGIRAELKKISQAKLKREADLRAYVSAEEAKIRQAGREVVRLQHMLEQAVNSRDAVAPLMRERWRAFPDQPAPGPENASAELRPDTLARWLESSPPSVRCAHDCHAYTRHALVEAGYTPGDDGVWVLDVGPTKNSKKSKAAAAAGAR